MQNECLQAYANAVMAKVLLGQQIQYLENIILVFKKGPGGAITYSSLVTHRKRNLIRCTCTIIFFLKNPFQTSHLQYLPESSWIMFTVVDIKRAVSAMWKHVISVTGRLPGMQRLCLPSQPWCHTCGALHRVDGAGTPGSDEVKSWGSAFTAAQWHSCELFPSASQLGCGD